jgi:hypothetical protein
MLLPTVAAPAAEIIEPMRLKERIEIEDATLLKLSTEIALDMRMNDRKLKLEAPVMQSITDNL